MGMLNSYYVRRQRARVYVAKEGGGGLEREEWTTNKRTEISEIREEES
jgi:hypothetical protein